MNADDANLKNIVLLNDILIRVCPRKSAANKIPGLSGSGFVDRSATRRCTADAPLFIRMKGRLVVDGDLFAGRNVAQCNKQDMIVENLHVGVGLA